MYGFHWDAVPNEIYAKLIEYTGDGIALTDFKDMHGRELRDAEKDAIIIALKNAPREEIFIISIECNNGGLIQNT